MRDWTWALVWVVVLALIVGTLYLLLSHIGVPTCAPVESYDMGAPMIIDGNHYYPNARCR